MGSPFRQTDQSRLSPSRSALHGYQRSPRGSPRASASTQLAEEMHRLLLDDDVTFKKALDNQAREQQKAHVDSLGRSLALHTAIRKSAEQAYERIQLEQERERLRREAEEFARKEEARRLLENERKKQEEARQLAEKRRQEEESQRLARQKRQEEEQKKEEERREKEKKEDARKKLEEAEIRKKEEAKKQATDRVAAEQASATKAVEEAKAQALREQKIAQPVSQSGELAATVQSTQGTLHAKVPAGVTTQPAQRRAVHNAYLEIHKRLKEVRKRVATIKMQDRSFKEDVDAWRQKVKATVGQVNKNDKDANRKGLAKISEILAQALQSHTQPTIDMSQFFLNNPSPGQAAPGSLTLIFLLNVFVKAIIGQLDREVQPVYPAEKGDYADPIGLMLVSLFADPRFQYNGCSLIDICWAKYHRECPFLFGVPLLRPVQNPKDTGALAAGFAAITLRDFKNHRTFQNPAPNRLFWEALARITNTPSASQKRAHYICIASLLNHTFVPRFIKFFGKAALVALRHALVTFPQTAPLAGSDPKTAAIRQESQVVFRMVEDLDKRLHLKL